MNIEKINSRADKLRQDLLNYIDKAPNICWIQEYTGVHKSQISRIRTRNNVPKIDRLVEIVNLIEEAKNDNLV